jgi:tRNA A37 threonylcarbamoyladenosine modification protein TsaB
MAKLLIDTPDPAVLRLILQDDAGTTLDRADIPLEGYVDNLLLTAVDKLLKENTMDRFALNAVLVGARIDKNTSLCRIVKSFASAVAVTPAEGR